MITTIRPKPNDFSLFLCYLLCFWHSPILVEDVVADFGHYHYNHCSKMKMKDDLTTFHCQTSNEKDKP